MPDDPTPGGQAPPSPVPGDSTPPTNPEPESFDLAYVKGLRKEAAGYRVKLQELEARAKAQDDAKLSETERLQARLQELEQKDAAHLRERQEFTTRAEVVNQAHQLNIVDPDAAYRLLDLAEIEFDAQGKPTNLTKVLGELVKARPYLAGPRRTGSADGAVTGGQAQPMDMNNLIRRAAGRAN